MTAGTFGKLYAQTLVTFLALDAVWIGAVAKAFYAEQIGFLLAPQPNWGAAVAFYLLYVLGLVAFVVVPALARQSTRFAAFSGGFFGLVTYATYDLTNLATVARWPFGVTVVDMIWGTALCACVAALTVRTRLPR